MSANKKRVCVDVGGTFTDCLVLDGKGILNKFKASTTPSDPTTGFMNGMTKAAKHYDQTVEEFLADVEVLIHGTTLATNILLTGRGAKTGMLTTANFRDILEIRRGIKPVDVSLYNLFIPPNRPLIPRHLRLGVRERTLYNGEITEPLSEEDVTSAVEVFKKEGVQSIAVCFLHSYANPENERRAAELCGRLAPEMIVTTSHETLPVWREFERFNTTTVGAYVGPATINYLNALEKQLKDRSFRGTFLMMLANGLVQTVAQTIRKPVYLLHSGPAAAPSGAVYLGDLLGGNELLSVDMGGTSFDICLVRNREIPTTTETWCGDQRVAIKMVDIASIGAGGGSIARIDSLGLLKVGPESAGADPGPACYGKGTQPTVTDANLVLGYIPHDYFLGGEMSIDLERSREVMKGIGKTLGMDEKGVAAAIFATVNSNMADEINAVSTRRGHDVRDCVLIAGGGGGGIHCGFMAASLGIRKVIVPQVSALYSAFGMFAMDIGLDYARSYVARTKDVDFAAMNRLYREMEEEALTTFSEHGIAADRVSFTRTLEMRYIGQFHEVETPFANGEVTKDAIAAADAAFSARHEELFTFSMPWKGSEILTMRLNAKVQRAPFQLAEITKGGADASGALKRRRLCRFGARDIDTPVYDGTRLVSGNSFAGPAIIEETTTTVVVPEGYQCTVDAYKNYILTLNA